MVEAAEEKTAGRRHGEEDRHAVQEIDFFSHMERKIDRLFKKLISFWLLLCSIICYDCVYFLIPSTLIRVHRDGNEGGGHGWSRLCGARFFFLIKPLAALANALIRSSSQKITLLRLTMYQTLERLQEIPTSTLNASGNNIYTGGGQPLSALPGSELEHPVQHEGSQFINGFHAANDNSPPQRTRYSQIDDRGNGETTSIANLHEHESEDSNVGLHAVKVVANLATRSQ
ncbi:hypothetical protein L2E82_30121 [Cichorium intybus]|uniref:Uncharacterized protein n=1 Tax=Cichorium intybus TaxID=13427 RepID=A0ACB9CZH6_CICIN|nr:hypothetical protein L2E82_30121 [Cichorium intybus]